MNAKPIVSCRRFAAVLFLALSAMFPPMLVKGALAATPLSIQCPANIVLWTCGRDIIHQYPQPTVSGGCSDYQVVCNPPPGTPWPVGVTTVNCSVVDGCRETDRCTFTITVRSDTEPPSIRCPEDIEVTTCKPATACGAIVTYPAPLATDNSGMVAVTCMPPSGSFFLCGETVVTCVAQDRCDNKDSCQFRVKVSPGDNPPTIRCPQDLLLTTCSNSAVLNYPLPLVNPPPPETTVVCKPPVGTLVPHGVTVVTCVASNDCGIARCEFSVVVRPVPQVEIRCPIDSILLTVPCGSNCVPVVYPRPVVLNGELESCHPAPGTCLPVGVHTIKCRATNECGSVSCSFDIRIIPSRSEPPRILCPSNIVAWACDSNGVVVTYPPPTVNPGSDPNPTVTCHPPSGSVFPVGVTSVTCSVKDDCNGEDRCTFTVTVRRDMVPPEIRCPSNIVRCVARDTQGLTINYPVTATDNADPNPSVECEPPSGSFFPLGTTTVLCHAKDECGNVARCSFTITLLPDTVPVLSIEHHDGYVVVCWTKTCRCYKLQSTRSLNRPILWVDVETEPVDFGTHYCVRLPATAAHRFFRLIACDQPTAPVYGVAGTGITREQGARIVEALGLPGDKVRFDGGALLYLDPINFQAIPTEPIQDEKIIDELARGSENERGELSFEGINFEKLRSLRPVPGDKAIDLFEHALRLADALPDNGEWQATHSMFEAEDEKGQPLMPPQPIDTHVHQLFNLKGVPLIGPGAKLGLVLGPNGKPTALQLATRKLEPIQDVPILSLEEAARRCALLYPGLQPSATPRLMYFAPSLELGSVQKIIPCYECGGEGTAKDKQVSLLRSIIPATDDPALVPVVELTAVARENLVNVRATVKGGAGPYTYEWLSSSTDLSEFPPTAASIEYVAQPRAGETKEIVRVFVTDANGVRVQASETLEVAGGPGPIAFFPAVGGVRDYGTERAVSDLGAGNQSSFNNRFTSDGVYRRFNWTGSSSWERDFKQGGTGLDHLYVDNVDITFYIGHGYGGGFTFESEHDDDTLFYTDAVGDWGNLDLEFMALLSCQVLKGTWDGKSWATRWGPTFAGLHLLLGFETNAHDWPAFGGRFADWTLGRFGFLPAIPVRSAWFMAKAEEQPSGNIAVAMGVIGPAGCSNYNDYFWGKGPVGPDIRGNQIHGYWRVTFQ